MAKKKKRDKSVVARCKRTYPTVKAAMKSLDACGYKPHMLKTALHTGNYWRWRAAP